MDISNASNGSTSGAKENYQSVQYGTDLGSICFGRLNLGGENEELSASVTSGVTLQSFDSNHYISLDAIGPRAGWSLHSSPGPFQVLCASKTSSSEPNNPDGIGLALIAEQGDIVISAKRGRVRISGIDIDLRSQGYNTKNGAINLDANNSVNINAPRFNVDSEVGIKLNCTGAIELVSNTAVNFTSKTIKGLSAAAASVFTSGDPFAMIDYINKNAFN